MSITLSEAESRRVVSRYGVPVSPFVTGTSTAEVLAAVETDASVTFPVVAKLCGRAIAHKTERGLVRLRIADTDALAAACDELLSKAVPDDGEVEVLVSTMVDGNRELIAGLNDDPQFGMTVMVGITPPRSPTSSPIDRSRRSATWPRRSGTPRDNRTPSPNRSIAGAMSCPARWRTTPPSR